MNWLKSLWQKLLAALGKKVKLPTVPDILTPEAANDPTRDLPIEADPAVVYVAGNKADKGPEISNSNIGSGINLRLYNNAGNLPVRASRAWYPIDAAVVPAGTYEYAFNADGSLRVTGKDFVSTRTGQRYRWEGCHIGTSESNPVRQYAQCTIPASDVCGALILNWAAVEAK